MPKRRRNEYHSGSLTLQSPPHLGKIATMPSPSTVSEESEIHMMTPSSYMRSSQQAYSSITSDTLTYQRKTATSLLPTKSPLDSRVFPNKEPMNNSFFIGLPNMGVGSTPNLPPSSGSKHSRHLRQYQVSFSALEKNLREQGEVTLSKRRPGALPSSPLKPLLSDNLYLIFRKNKIYTSVPAPLNRAKILLRNTIGKFAWTVKHYRAFTLNECPGVNSKPHLKIQKSDVGQMKKNMLTLYDPSLIAQKLLSYTRKYSEPENSDPESSNLILLIDLETADRHSSMKRKPVDEQKSNNNQARHLTSLTERMDHTMKQEPLQFVMEEEKVPISLESNQVQNSYRSSRRLSGSVSPRAQEPSSPKPDFLKKMVIQTLGMHPELDKFRSLGGGFKDHEFNKNQEQAQKEIAESQHYYNIEQLLFPRCANQIKLSLRQQFQKFLQEVSFTFQLEGASSAQRRFKMKGDSTDQMCIANREVTQSFDGFRAFVTRLGIVDVLAFTAELNMVEEVNQFQASLNILDRDAFFRKQLRVGMVYVKAGQCEESQVFANNEGSLPFEEFIRSVGRVKDLSTHRGYSGGLMAPTNGTHFCYAASASYELAFHVNTLMPTVTGDKQQIAKKKFIGNDSIHVVWSEAQRPYRQTTIKSSFNFVHLVVHPLPSGLFKVSALRKRDKVDFFGPLLDGMVVSKEILPSLVRATIVNAERSIRDMRLRSLKSYHSRKKLIKQSIYDRVQAKLKESVGPEGYNINNLISTQNKLSSELFR